MRNSCKMFCFGVVGEAILLRTGCENFKAGPSRSRVKYLVACNTHNNVVWPFDSVWRTQLNETCCPKLGL